MMASEPQLRHWFWALGSIMLVSFAQLALKLGMQQFPGELVQTNVFVLLQSEYWQPVLLPIALGLLAYSISVLCWLSALVGLPLSVAYPLLSLSYLLVYVGAIFIPDIGEKFNTLHLIGTALVMLGIGLIAVPAKSSRVNSRVANDSSTN